MAAIESFAGSLRAKPGVHWVRRPSQRSNFYLGRRSSSDMAFQNNIHPPAPDFAYQNWNLLHHHWQMDRRSRLQPNYNQISPPRSFEDLHRERSYLLSSLQQEDHKATELLKRLSPLEASLQHFPTRSGQRKAKRQLGWLRHRLGETTKQEQSILARLGQVSWEIQSRERWVQVECERREMEMLMDGHSNTWRAPGFDLDATRPEFRPSGQYAWPPQQQYYEDDYFIHQQQPSGQLDPSSIHTEGAFANQLPFELPAPIEQVEQKLEERIVNTFGRSNSVIEPVYSSSISCDKRLSMPTLSTEWPAERENC